MLSGSTIRSMQQEAAARAAREKRVPFVYWPGDKIAAPFPFPSLGDYVPKGWTHVDDLFVDSSGFGGPGEPAMQIGTFEHTVAQLSAAGAERHVTIGFGITSVGEFQAYVGVFEKPWEGPETALPETVARAMDGDR